jgi:colanic acid biosynthesis glycosyl transferase WcaI
MELHFQRANVRSDKLRIIPNWSDEAAVVPVPHEANDLRRQWGLHGKFVVGYSGNLGRAHECDTMFEAARLLKDDPRIVFLMVGGGFHTDALKARAASVGLTNIAFQPYQPLEALADSLSAADLHWISLKPELEGLIVPSKVYGILAAGRPILAVTDADGEIARLVNRYECGMHVALGDHHRFAQLVRELADDPDRAKALGEAARRAATQSFTRAAALASWRETVTAPAA